MIATVRCGSRLVLVVAILLGVLGMHALAFPASVHGHPVGSHHGVAGFWHTGSGPVGAEHAGHGSSVPCAVPCPDDTGHRGAVCEAAAVASAPTLPPLAPTGTAVPSRQSRLTVTAAEDAAHGSGCGPPSLTALSISRT